MISQSNWVNCPVSWFVGQVKLALAVLIVIIYNQTQFQNLALQGKQNNDLKARIDLTSSILCSCSSSIHHIGLHIDLHIANNRGLALLIKHAVDSRWWLKNKLSACLFVIVPIWASNILVGETENWTVLAHRATEFQFFSPALRHERMSTEFHFHLDELKWNTLRCFSLTYRIWKAKLQHVEIHTQMAWKKKKKLISKPVPQ